MIIARLGNAYGDQKNRGIIGVVLRAARDNGTLDIQGDGSQERDFVHVEDAAASLAGLACAKISGHQVFNVCSGRSHSVNDVIEKIRRMSGAEILVRYEAKSEGKQRNGGDNRKIISELGVSFRDFDTGLQNAYLKYTLAR
jgi:nucleoside-diphosphate-sugar epimerase